MQSRNSYVIPHACFDKENFSADQQAQLMEMIWHEYRIQSSEVLLSCFGFVNRNKRPEIVLQVLRQLLEKCDTFAYKHYSTGSKALWALRPSSAKKCGGSELIGSNN